MMLLRRGMVITTSALKSKLNFVSSSCSFGSKVSDIESTNRYDIELIDDDSWRLASGLARAWLEEKNSPLRARDDSADKHSPIAEKVPDFEDIDSMRIRGDLFFKLDRDSKEFEEYSYEFHRRRKKNPKEERDSSREAPKDNPSPKKKEIPKVNPPLPDVVNTRFGPMSLVDQTVKKKRTPTFNQLTEPYHKPFCLDIFISKASVRACVVHRATSKVVAVAHSISKDMKFDLSSTRDETACVSVGSVLAQRALADDIHDVVYTPRRGDKLEGKLLTVVRSIVDNGINVNVKIKQRKFKKKSILNNSLET